MKRTALSLLYMVIMVGAHVSYALTSGPSAPEPATYEPPDATDMVNLQTGDFTYVIPLMNVPSPNSDFPISIAYHSGIKTDQEASWTGLGWNLNVGSINRSVVGFPDDFDEVKIQNGQEGPMVDGYEGRTIGLDIAGIGIGLTWDNSKGTMGFSGVSSFSFGIPALGLSISASTSGIGLCIGMGNIGISISTDGKGGGGVGIGVSNDQGASIGLSSSSGLTVQGMGAALGGSGMASAGANSYTINQGISIPCFNYSYAHYYSNPIEFESAYGFLHLGQTKLNPFEEHWVDNDLDEHFTTYNGETGLYMNANYTFTKADENPSMDYGYNVHATEIDPTRGDHFTIMNKDMYSVMGNSISGTIIPMRRDYGDLAGRPYHSVVDKAEWKDVFTWNDFWDNPENYQGKSVADLYLSYFKEFFKDLARYCTIDESYFVSTGFRLSEFTETNEKDQVYFKYSGEYL